MKKLISALALMGLAGAIFANTIQAPKLVCLVFTTSGYTAWSFKDFRINLSVPGEIGKVSPIAVLNKPICVSPYSVSEPDQFSVFAQGAGRSIGLPNYAQCSHDSWTTKGGISKAPNITYWYQAHDTAESGHQNSFTCIFDGTGPTSLSVKGLTHEA